MRHESRSISKSRRNTSVTPSKTRTAVKSTSESDYYYCHLNNAMYMGGIKAFQKHGRGVIIHDDGTSVISSYFNDFRHGQNIFYKEHCILSLQYHKNKVIEAVMRIPSHLILIRYNKDQQPDGKALLMDYDNKSIFYVLYRRGVITQKRQQQNKSILHKIFDLQKLQYLIGPAHAKAIKFDIEKDQHIASQMIGKRFHAGFYKKGLMNGLGFILNVKCFTNQNYQNATHEQQFSVKASERGYFYNSQLNGAGEKWFRNGNYYYGDFKHGQFEGTGILKNQAKNNWVYGQFHSNNLSQLIDYSHQGDLKKLSKVILSMHERRNNWINNYIEIPQHGQYLKQIDKILISNPTQQMRNLRQRKEQVLRKIQNNFMHEDQNNQDNSNRNYLHYQEVNKYQNNDRTPGAISRSSSRSRYTNQFKSEKSKEPSSNQNQDNNFHSSQLNYDNSHKRNIKPIQIMSKQHQTKTDKSRTTTAAMDSRQKSPNSRLMRTPTKSQQNLLQKPSQETFALDSKRLIGKSRIFRNFSEQEEQLPKFNYNAPH